MRFFAIDFPALSVLVELPIQNRNKEPEARLIKTHTRENTERLQITRSIRKPLAMTDTLVENREQALLRLLRRGRWHATLYQQEVFWVFSICPLRNRRFLTDWPSADTARAWGLQARVPHSNTETEPERFHSRRI